MVDQKFVLEWLAAARAIHKSAAAPVLDAGTCLRCHREGYLISYVTSSDQQHSATEPGQESCHYLCLKCGWTSTGERHKS
jgi:hypothetical protein